jgi:IclR family acetate operon transcriptional repressor
VPLESVDNALRMLLLLGDREELGVTEAAGELDIAPSTAHRLFATLRERGFVVQGENRSYRRGPALDALGGRRSRAADLVSASRTAMERLCAELDETCHLMVRDGRTVRVLASVEAEQVLRVGSRAGAVLPAHLVSGGKMLLADLDGADFDRLYPAEGVPDIGLDAAGVARLERELRAVRRRRYAVNNGQSEPGLAAVAVAIHGAQGPAIGSLSVSVPSVRYYPARVPALLQALQEASATTARLMAA